MIRSTRNPRPLLRRLFLAAPLAFVMGPAAANPYLDTCLDPAAPPATAADQCRRAAEWGGLSAREAAQAWTTAGVALSELERDGDALAALDKAVAADPGYQPGWAMRAISRARRGLTEGALSDWEEALRRAPRDWRTRLARAAFLLREGRADDALADLDRAAAMEPRAPDVHFNRGLALAELGRTEAAREAFGHAIRLDPGDAEAHLRRALTWAEDDPAAALSDLDAAVRLAPDWAAAWATRGRLQERLGDADAAMRDYRRAFELGLQAPWLNERIEALGG
ncbi:MAG: tetratricopeptide repeat protein [Paracoccaceae bacterium]